MLLLYQGRGLHRNSMHLALGRGAPGKSHQPGVCCKSSCVASFIRGRGRGRGRGRVVIVACAACLVVIGDW